MGFMDIGDGELSAVVQLDTSLVDMIRENEAIIRSYMHCGGGKSLWDAGIAWDYPAQVVGDQWDEDAAKLSHAIGFIAGVAAAFDVTPIELLDIIAHEQKRKPRAIDGDPAYADVVLQRGAGARIMHPSEQKRAKRKPSQRRQKLPKVR